VHIARIKLILVWHLCAAIFAPNTSSAAFFYDESIDGDIAGNGVTQNFFLSDGINIVRGNSRQVVGPLFPYVFGEFDVDDFFYFSVPIEYEVVSMRYAYNTVLSDSLLFYDQKLKIFGGEPFSQLFGANFTSLSTDLILFDQFSVPFISTPTSRAYLVINGLTFGGLLGPWEINTDWEFQIGLQHTEVPLPGTLSLLGVGLIALGITRRRQA